MIKHELQYGAKGEKAGLELFGVDCSEARAIEVEEDVAASGKESCSLM